MTQTPRASLDTLLEGKAIGRYRLFRRLASGGMGSVFLGWQPSAGGVMRSVAAKVIRDGDLSAKQVPLVLREARIASCIRHPNVVALTDVVESPYGPVLILEYVAGDSLSRVLEASDEAVSPAILARIMVDALEGLHAAHEATNDRGLPLGVVHRDVSPQNILIDEVGYAKIADFGVAKALDHLNTTESGYIPGKLGYMAPEQLDGQPVDPRADIWAMGIVMWQVLAGVAPFAGIERGVLLKRVLLGEVDAPTKVRPCPPELAAVCMRALSLRPGDRYESARQMALAVERAQTPAMHREVARWLRERVGPALHARAALVADMLAEARREEANPTPVATNIGPTPTGSTPAGPRGSAGSDPVHVLEVAEQTSVTTRLSQDPIDQAPARPSRRIGYVAAAVATAAIAGGVAWARIAQSTTLPREAPSVTTHTAQPASIPTADPQPEVALAPLSSSSTTVRTLAAWTPPKATSKAAGLRPDPAPTASTPASSATAKDPVEHDRRN